jgi:hypothetical protein
LRSFFALDWGAVTMFAIAFVAVGAILLAGPAIDPGLGTFWERTISYQANRDSPFSIWGQADLGWLHTTIEALTVVLALAVAFVPRRRDVRQVAALGAAVLIAAELCADHWFYLYIPWFFPLVAVALAVAPVRERERVTEVELAKEEEGRLAAAAPA